MTSGDREMLGDRIVRWGIEHGDWGTDDEEKAEPATVAAFGVFLNGSLTALVGPSAEGERGEVEAEGGEEKEGKEGGGATAVFRISHAETTGGNFWRKRGNGSRR
jgi:hypothetical protein